VSVVQRRHQKRQSTNVGSKTSKMPILHASNAQERRKTAQGDKLAKSKADENGDEVDVNDCDDYLIIDQIEQVYLRLEKIEQKLITDLTYCPNYELVEQTNDPMKPNMSHLGLRNRLYELVLCQDSGIYALLYYYFVILLIAISIASLIFQEQFEHDVWNIMETFITVFFTIEYFLTLAIVSDHVAYLMNPLAACDLLAVLPWYIETGLHPEKPTWILLIRLLRLARTTRIREAPNPYVVLIGKTLVGLRKILVGIVAWLLGGSLIIGTIMRVIEEDTFPTIPIGMWFGLVTITTVGYGDMSPSDDWGYIIGSIAIIFGLCLCSIVLQAVGQIYNDEIEILKDQLGEIEQALYDDGKLEVKNGDDLHFAEGVTFMEMVDSCLADDKCYPNINTLLEQAHERHLHATGRGTKEMDELRNEMGGGVADDAPNKRTPVTTE